ncbi:Aste57867_963 [Aphanomyces stellatus]|uniref:Aste57867_963 protein n=1 Tax=Aphanomyces stellatus TaxID=120398 RepID=A0A485K515_9STRA|nr:hypothetical protein As57867_000962 [Aphanomyces stellatus]VFT78185.1 Aste57867_963 [Aphanomyces stellatus]
MGGTEGWHLRANWVWEELAHGGSLPHGRRCQRSHRVGWRQHCHRGLVDAALAIHNHPQDPVLISSSLRFNVDLECAQEGSLGRCRQRRRAGIPSGREGEQTVAAALHRALLRGRAGRSHGNLESDRLIQQTVKECFKDVTMLIIANRLDTLIDSDRIFFLDHSHVVEFDAPSVLLANDASAFAQLAKQAHIGN